MSRKEVFQWLDHARADIRVAREILRPDSDYIAVVLFLVQQAAEKSLKGLIRFRGTTPPRTHNLDRLAGLLNEQALAPLLTEIIDYTDFAVIFRYPGEEDEPVLEEAEHALEMVQQLYAAILELIPEELRPARHD